MGEPAKVLEFRKAPSFGDMLKKTAVAQGPKKTKSSMPLLSPPDEIKKAVDDYIEAAILNKKTVGAMDVNGQMIIGWVDEQQDKDGFSGKFHGSYQVEGVKETVKYVSTNRYSISQEDQERLMEVFGDRYPDMINEKHSVKLKDAVFENPDLQYELMDLIGDRFGDFFESTCSLSVAEGFSEKVYSVLKEEDLPVLRTFCKRYKPSLR